MGARMDRVLTRSTGETRIKIDPDFGDREIADTFRLRRWRIPRGALPAPVRTRLLNDGEITATWDQMRPRIRRKSITVRLDRSQDDESTAVTDGDLA